MFDGYWLNGLPLAVINMCRDQASEWSLREALAGYRRFRRHFRYGNKHCFTWHMTSKGKKQVRKESLRLFHS